MPLPILYSFRRCPYAMRARMALAFSQKTVELREVILKDKPDELITASPKATVPVLALTDGSVLDESLDIMYWALTNSHLDNQTSTIHLPQFNQYNEIALIKENDGVFKKHLDNYKYVDRNVTHNKEQQHHHREQGETFLLKLENILEKQKYLFSDQLTVIDYAIFPFIRQFAHVDKSWFDQSQYHCLQNWLNKLLTSDLFISTMIKYPQWKKHNEATLFPGNRLTN